VSFCVCCIAVVATACAATMSEGFVGSSGDLQVPGLQFNWELFVYSQHSHWVVQMLMLQGLPHLALWCGPTIMLHCQVAIHRVCPLRLGAAALHNRYIVSHGTSCRQVWLCIVLSWTTVCIDWW